jgi:FixJ family two-component response regulator
MSSPHSTIYMIGPDRMRLKRFSQLIQRTGDEAIFVPTLADFLAAGKVRRAECIILDMTPAEENAGENDKQVDPFLLLGDLMRSNSSLTVICLGPDNNLRRAVRAMRMGAFDYLPLSCTTLEFRTSLDEAFELHLKNQEQTADRRKILARYEQLTAREKQVFALAVSGLPNKEIAENLNLALQTVKIHRGRVMAKMAAGSALDLYRFAQILGHIPPFFETPESTEADADTGPNN